METVLDLKKSLMKLGRSGKLVAKRKSGKEGAA